MSAAGTLRALALICDPKSKKWQREMANVYLRGEIVLIRDADKRRREGGK